jgi:hypothetical protein
MGEEKEWLTGPRFADDFKRDENGPVISARMACWCANSVSRS